VKWQLSVQQEAPPSQRLSRAKTVANIFTIFYDTGLSDGIWKIDSGKCPMFTHSSSALQTDGRTDGQTDGIAISVAERLQRNTR